MGGAPERAAWALRCAAIVAGLLAMAACGVVFENPVVGRGEDALRSAMPSAHLTLAEGHQCGEAEAAFGEVSFQHADGGWERQSFAYANGEAALKEDTDKFDRLMAVCNAALQAEINAAQTNRAAISAAQRQRGM
jgi:hypothetical protein